MADPEAPPPLADEVSDTAAPWWRRPWVLGAAGAAAAVAIIVWVGPPFVNYGNDATRGSGIPPVTLTRPSADAPFDRVFTWRPVKGATSYQVVIFAPDGTRSFEVRDLTTAGVKLSESVKLPPGGYFVQVTAFKTREPVAESALTPFKIK